MDVFMSTSSVRRASDYARLCDQIEWYDRKAVSAQRKYKRTRLTILLLASSIPLVALLPEPADARGFLEFVPSPKVLSSLAGALIVVLEGLLQLNGWHKNWLNYRKTCEALRVEQAKYLHSVKPYNVSDAAALVRLVERTETLMSDEHTSWFEDRRPQPGPADEEL